MLWKQITDYLATASWITKIASWTKVPELVLLNKIVVVLTILLDVIKRRILIINQKHSDVIIQNTESAGTHIEEERQRPLPAQNNDVLREEARRRHDGTGNTNG